MKRWQLQDAKSRLSEVVASSSRAPQEITVRGRPVAVVISRELYDRLAGRRRPFLEFLRRSPLAGVDLKLSRDRSPSRDVPL